MKHSNYVYANRELKATTVETYSRDKSKRKPHQHLNGVHPACFDCPREDCVAGSTKKCKHIKKLEKEDKA